MLRTPHSGDHQPPLEGDKVIVSGGHVIGSAENFVLLERLTAALGGAVGGSLQVADAGGLRISRQIGQSGKYVRRNSILPWVFRDQANISPASATG